MPTLPKPQLTEPESPVGCRVRSDVSGTMSRSGPDPSGPWILRRTRPAAPGREFRRDPNERRRRGIASIASALTVAAAASAEMPVGVLIASLKKVSKNPSLFFARELPQPVEWAIADDYQRDDERPGTHWRDVWGDQVATSPGEVEQPTELNIAKAADAAIARLQETRKAGRPYNQADQILAVRLGAIFRRSGQPIRRRREPVMRRDEVVYVESGPVYDFLELVLKPLRAHLREKLLAPVTTETIVRRITEDFPKAS